MTTAIQVQGTCKPGFERVKEAFEDNFASHGEVGAALALNVDGELAVDLWGGYADPQRTRPWEHDTIVNVFSTTKGITTTCAHRLVDQGLLDLDAPVARYWPEFAQGGKETLPVRYLLCHQAGLPCVKDLIPLDRSYEWTALTDALAVQEPWWKPGPARLPHSHVRSPRRKLFAA
jgi:CubicO group peptidase (beta-lactamase class C family)